MDEPYHVWKDEAGVIHVEIEEASWPIIYHLEDGVLIEDIPF